MANSFLVSEFMKPPSDSYRPKLLQTDKASSVPKRNTGRVMRLGCRMEKMRIYEDKVRARNQFRAYNSLTLYVEDYSQAGICSVDNSGVKIDSQPDLSVNID